MRLSALAFIVLLSACASLPPGATRLADIARDPAAYRNQVVTTCGWATNQFENSKITTTAWRGQRTPGLEVSWGDDTPQTRIGRPEWRCLTGYINRACDDSGEEEVMCVSRYQWILVEEGRS